MYWDSTYETLYIYGSLSWKKSGGKQVVVGPAKTSDSTALTSATYVDFPTNNPTTGVFTATRSGKYKVWCQPILYNSSAGAATYLKINQSMGAGTDNYSTTYLYENNDANYNRTAYVAMVVTLTAGQNYQFDLQGRRTAGNVILSNSQSDTGVSMIAEELD